MASKQSTKTTGNYELLVKSESIPILKPFYWIGTDTIKKV